MQIWTWLEPGSESMSKIIQIGPTKVQILLRGLAFLLHFISEIWKIIFVSLFLMNIKGQCK